MATVIKQRSKGSPGVAVLTSNELLFGVIGKSKRALKKIQGLRSSGKWIFGVHINGSFHGKNIEVPPCISFVLCGDIQAVFLENVTQPIFARSAEYFVHHPSDNEACVGKEWDLIVVSRISEAKRFAETIDILTELLKLNPSLRIKVIATYCAENSTEKAYVAESAQKLKELLRYEVSVAAIDSTLFGFFPLSNKDIQSTIARARGLLITSKHEGGPRVLAEAAILGVPIYISEGLKSNLQSLFESLGVIKIPEGCVAGAAALNRHLSECFTRERAIKVFNPESNRAGLKNDIEMLLRKSGFDVDGVWYLDDLSVRLPGHSRVRNLQILHSEKLFNDWCCWIDILDANQLDKRLDEALGNITKPLLIRFREFAENLKRVSIKSIKRLHGKLFA